jgi:primosomal protein N' (replication factor Y)
VETTVRQIYAEVVLDDALEKSLDYQIPPVFQNKVSVGSRVLVSVRNRLTKGFVIGIKGTSEWQNVKPIRDVLSEDTVLPEDLIALAKWISEYYLTPFQRVLKMILPSSLRKDMKAKEQLYVMRTKTREEIRAHCEKIRGKHPKQAAVLDVMLQATKGVLLSELLEASQTTRSPLDTLVKQGFLSVDIVRIDRSPLMNEEYFKTKPKALNDEQAQALGKIICTLEKNVFETHLLYGITGSGKTEVYLQAIDKALQQGKGVIMLVPEIALTTQTIERFRSRFEGKIAILHHRLSHGERTDEWRRMAAGEAKIVIGARSAIFSPIRNLGLIIVDEEHEMSYKNMEEMPTYHARDIAVVRGKFSNSGVILGSATPSMESYTNALEGKYLLSELKQRPTAAQVPEVKIVDMRVEFERNKGFTHFSSALLDGIKARMEKGEQTILFLNRRGYHTSLQCLSCQTAVKCKHCDVALTFHLGENKLACHLCGYALQPPPTQCPECKSPAPMKFKGAGTEQVERALHAVFPEVRTIRVDADTTRHKGSQQKLFREFGAGKADVLIGTQMIAKGLHFSEVTLVGVLNCDAALNIPDFRASETAFQLMTQVAGRAGRGVTAGEVIIQTTMPDNPAILYASQQDFVGFYGFEKESRKAFEYPPFAQMVKFHFSGEHENTVHHTANRFRQHLLERLPKNYALNPTTPAGHGKVKDRFHFQFFVRGHSVAVIRAAVRECGVIIPRGVKLLIDVNCLSTF